MKQIVLIETDGCVSCIGLEQEVKSVLSQFDEFELTVIREQEEAQTYLDNYPIEKLPSLLVLDEDELLGQVTGYQPAFILEVWLSNLLEKGR